VTGGEVERRRSAARKAAGRDKVRSESGEVRTETGGLAGSRLCARSPAAARCSAPPAHPLRATRDHAPLRSTCFQRPHSTPHSTPRLHGAPFTPHSPLTGRTSHCPCLLDHSAHFPAPPSATYADQRSGGDATRTRRISQPRQRLCPGQRAVLNSRLYHVIFKCSLHLPRSLSSGEFSF